jgi:hypothetical protein
MISVDFEGHSIGKVLEPLIVRRQAPSRDAGEHSPAQAANRGPPTGLRGGSFGQQDALSRVGALQQLPSALSPTALSEDLSDCQVLGCDGRPVLHARLRR